MKVLVIGGAGYVGSVLIEELLERGYAVKVFDRLFYGDQGLTRIKDRIELVVGDMRMIDPKILKGVDVVINIGGLSNDPTAEYNPKANFEINTRATISSARLCKQHGIKRYIFASTCSIYDIGVEAFDKDIVFDVEAKVSPKATYSKSKFEAEKFLLSMSDKNFCPVILRKGTIFGFSPRMRYDLVVNTFLKDILTKGYMTAFYGGEMWRPLVSIRDVARAYIACLEAPEERVKGEIFNLVYSNFRISELALRVKEALKCLNIKAEIIMNYGYSGVRSYRVSGKKLEKVLGFRPIISVEEAVIEMVKKIKEYNYTDFDNPKYYNIKWMKFLEEADKIIRVTGTVFETPYPKLRRVV